MKKTTSMKPLNGKLQLRKLGQESWDRNRLLGLLERIQKVRIGVLGDVGIDRYTMGAVERISPEAPVPIVRVEQEVHKLGLAANVADNIQALGGRALLAGLVGKDGWATEFRTLIRKQGISDRYLVVDPSRRTVLKERIVSDRQQLLRVDYETLHELSKKVEAALRRKSFELLRQAESLIVEDYAKGMLTPSLLREVFEEAERLGKWVSVDPNLKTPLSFYQGASLLTPNTKEAEALAGESIRDERSLLRVGSRILGETGARHVIVTRGKEGMAIFTRGVRAVHSIPTFAREVYDVSGAGDTVIATLTLALSAGATVEEAAILGNLAAGVEVGKRGTATVSCEEIAQFLELLLESGRRSWAP
jgi:rfaE bifunctional protein kinase chain/domain